MPVAFHGPCFEGSGFGVKGVARAGLWLPDKWKVEWKEHEQLDGNYYLGFRISGSGVGFS